MEAGGGSCGYVDDVAAEGAHQLAVARVGRVGADHIVAFVDGQGEGEQERRGTAFGDGHALGVELDVMALFVEPCDRLAQLGDAERRSVWERTPVALLAHGIADGLRGAEIRFAEAELDDIDTLGDHPVGFFADGHRPERVGLQSTLGQGR